MLRLQAPPNRCRGPMSGPIRCTLRSARPCAVADYQDDQTRVWSGTQNPHHLRTRTGAADPSARSRDRGDQARSRRMTTGSVYALAGVGLVLTYKTSGVFNFAHGALATVSAYLFYTLHVEHGMPWPIAAVCACSLQGPCWAWCLSRSPAGCPTSALPSGWPARWGSCSPSRRSW